MADELVFYTHPMSRGRIVRWMLEEIGQPYRTELLEYGTTMKAPAYLAVNPMGKVPAIRHGDTVVTEAAAICAYLADAFPEPRLAPPPGDRRRGPYYRWLFFGAGPLEAAWTNRAMGFVVPPERERMAGYGRFEAVVDTLEAAVSRTEYVVGDSFTAADVFARPLAGPILWAMAGTLPETTGDASRQPRSSAFLPEHIRVVERMTRPPEQRPVHDTIDNIADWLLESPRQISEGIAGFDEFAWRLVAAGMPLLRVTIHTPTLHPQFLGTTITWWRDTGETVLVMIAHEVADAIPHEKNPVRRVCDGRETLRRRLDLPDDELDFEVLIELRERGGTDYIALPIDGVYAAAYMLTFVTDRPDGFSDDELADLARVGRRLSITADRHNQWWITHNLLCAYLGANTGPKVLTGQIRRGTGMELTAVLWSSDLRGFTERSDRLPSERMIAILNALFEAQAAEIRGHGGEILKFIGDGLLAIFPITETDAVAAIAKAAVAAARNAVAAVARLSDHPALDGEPPLDIVVALHVGTVHYGNIGAADRLDFTVIGPAVNLVSRIENAAKMLGQPIVVSAELAAALDGVVSLGRHQLRGLSAPQELFAPG